MLRNSFQDLATEVAPLYKRLAPQAYQNQVPEPGSLSVTDSGSLMLGSRRAQPGGLLEPLCAYLYSLHLAPHPLSLVVPWHLWTGFLTEV